MKIFEPAEILRILDKCCDQFTFPMLDNGYVYLATTRLSAYRSAEDWALVIEVFGFSPRAGFPDIAVQTFGSRLHNRKTLEDYPDRSAYEMYLGNNPHNEWYSACPFDGDTWQDEENCELVSEHATEAVLRGKPIPLPNREELERHEIIPTQPSRIATFELCRYLADVARDAVLATEPERRTNVLPEMGKLIQLEEWNHPDVVRDDQRPSGSATFQQLANVLATGDIPAYAPNLPSNTHWRNWPEGGTL